MAVTMTSLTDSGKKVKVNFLEFIKNLKEKRFKSVKIIGTSKIQADIQRIMIHTRRKVLIFIQDTTIIRMQEQESATSQMSTLFLASITHDLRMPLNSALAFNHVLSTKFSNNKQACEILKMQKNGCLFMVSLIEDILDFARI